MSAEWRPLLMFGVAGLLVVACFLLAPPPAAQPALVQPRPDVWTDELCGSNTVLQTFVCPESNLCAVGVMFGTFARQNPGKVRLRLFAWGSNAPVREATGDGALIADNAFSMFAFAPVPDSRGGRYEFRLDAPDAALGRALVVWAASDDLYPEGASYWNGHPMAGDLTFSIHCAGGETQAHPSLWARLVAEPVFTGVYASLWVGIGAACWRTRDRQRRPHS